MVIKITIQLWDAFLRLTIDARSLDSSRCSVPLPWIRGVLISVER